MQPGIGVDQFGRTFVIRQEQCALLGAWLAKQQMTPGVEIPIAEDGEIVVYLVATYDECADALVKDRRAAVQHGRPDDGSLADPRFVQPGVAFRPAGHARLGCGATVCVVAWCVMIDAGLPPEQSDEAKIVQVVRVLDDPTQFRAFNLILPGEEPPLGGAAELPAAAGGRSGGTRPYLHHMGDRGAAGWRRTCLRPMWRPQRAG